MAGATGKMAATKSAVKKADAGASKARGGQRPGISGAPVAKKLHLRPGHRIGVVGAPEGFGESLGVLPDGATVAELPSDGGDRMDAVIAFVRKGAEVDAVITAADRAVKVDGLLWVCYPKGGEKAGTDLNRDTLFQQMKMLGFEGMGLASFNDAWSAMRFGPKK